MGFTLPPAQSGSATGTINITWGGIPDDPNLLTPDVLIAYFASKLKETDGQVQFLMANQTSRSNTAKALSALSDMLNASKNGLGEHDPMGQTISAEIDKAIERCSDPETKEQLQQLKANFDHTISDDPGDNGNKSDVSGDEMRSFMDRVSDIQSMVNEGGEMDMLRLQSLMSTRQQTLQLASNLVNNLADSSKAIIQNIHG